MRHGKGEYKWAKGDIYTGERVKNFKEGEVFEGLFHKCELDDASCPDYSEDKLYRDDLINGIGKYAWKTSLDIYEGEMKKDNRTGFGKYTFDDNSVYIGEWMNCDKHGKGLYTFASDKSTYDGEWKDG